MPDFLDADSGELSKPTAPRVDRAEWFLLWFVLPSDSGSSSSASRSSIEDGSVGDKSSGILPAFSEGGRVGESSKGTRLVVILVPSAFSGGELGDFALTGDFVRAFFSGFGDFRSDAASAVSSNDLFLSGGLTARLTLISLFLNTP